MNSEFKFKTSQRLYLPLKRLIGIFGSIIGIFVCAVLLWWWMVIVNTIVTRGHPFFVQERLGRNKKVFKLIKFRSMRIDANPNLAPSDMNVDTQQSMETGFGKFMRKTSLDETVQLLNILVGDMAFIGPRPGAAHNEEELVKAREKYTPNSYNVRPGLGGYAQLIMRRDHDPELKAKYDHEYVLKLSLWMDIKLFVRTLLRPFGRGAR